MRFSSQPSSTRPRTPGAITPTAGPSAVLIPWRPGHGAVTPAAPAQLAVAPCLHPQPTMLPATLNALGTHTPLPERPLGHDRGTPSVHSVVPGILLLRWRLVVLWSWSWSLVFVLGWSPSCRRLEPASGAACCKASPTTAAGPTRLRTRACCGLLAP